MSAATIRFGRYELDRERGLRHEKHYLRLTPKSLSVLWVLADRAGELVSKDELFRAVWRDTAVGDCALTSCIQEIRRALGDDARVPCFIETVHRKGYRFVAATASRETKEMGEVPPAGTARTQSTYIVGRETVLQQMFSATTHAFSGSRQVLFVSGEAGIGKTALVESFLDRVLSHGSVRTTSGTCVQHYGVHEPYQPLLDALTRLCRQDGGRFVTAVERYSPTWLAQLPALVTGRRLAALRQASVGATPGRMLRELNDFLEVVSAEAPIVLWLEDLHWSDMSTLEWISSFAQRPEPSRVLLLGTFRPPATVAAEHPLASVCTTLHARGFCQQIELAGLDESATLEYLIVRFPPSPGEREAVRRLARLIHERTRGNPLFVVNSVEQLVAHGLLVEQHGRWKVSAELDSSSLGISDDVRNVIQQQIGVLRPEDREILEIASVAGASFSAAAVAAAGEIPLNQVERTLSVLAQSRHWIGRVGVCEWPNATISSSFKFLHVLYSDVLYADVPDARRTDLHRRIGACEEAAFGVRAPEIAAELAMHFDRSLDKHRAGIYFQRAGENAHSRCAFREARTHFEKALDLLGTEPRTTEQIEREVKLTLGLGASIMATRGWSAPEVGQAFSRARALCGELPASDRLFPAMWGCWLYYLASGSLATAGDIASELLGLARKANADSLFLQGHHACWTTAFLVGNVGAARTHALEGLRLYRRDDHSGMAASYGCHDPQVCAQCFVAWTAALRGQTDEAFEASDRAIAMARDLQHPFSLAHAEVFATQIRHTLKDSTGTRAHAVATLSIAREHDFRLLAAWASVLEGWAKVEQEQDPEAFHQIDASLGILRAAGSGSFRSFFKGAQAAAYLTSGQIIEGLQSISEALAFVESSGERFWESELYRLRGELQLAKGLSNATDAENSLLRAIGIARTQGATLLWKRSKRSLASLWNRTGRRGEGTQLLRAPNASR